MGRGLIGWQLRGCFDWLAFDVLGWGVNKDIFLGQLRELLGVLGAGLIVWGLGTEALWTASGGLVMSLASLVWVVVAKVTVVEVVLSAVRKFLGALGAFLVVMEWMTPEKVTASIGVLTVLVPFVWSWWEKVPARGKDDVTKCLVFFLGLLACFSLVCCGQVRGTLFLLDPNAGAKAGLSRGGGETSGFIGLVGEDGRVVRAEIVRADGLETVEVVDAAEVGE